jgi:hypothetical protein
VVAAPDLLANSELPADAAPPASDLAAFPQSSDALFPHYFDAIPTATPPATYSPVVVATPDDAAPLTAESRTSPAPSSDNLNSGAFMNMLRRLQLSIKPGG